jgi:hypothetical protein
VYLKDAYREIERLEAEAKKARDNLRNYLLQVRSRTLIGSDIDVNANEALRVSEAFKQRIILNLGKLSLENKI